MSALRQQSAYNVRVESLRGVAALVVAAAHAGQVVVTSGGQRGELALMTDPNGSFWDSARQAYRWMTPAEGAVVLFFVISGYVLRLSLDRMKDREAAWIASNFLIRRALRLFPPVAFMVLIFAMFSVAGYGYPSSQLSLRSLISHAFLLDFRMNGVIWTLQAELLAAPIILICWFILSRWGPWPVRAIGTALCLLVVDGDAGHMLEGIWPGLAPVGIPSFLFAFVFGMLVAEWTELIQSEKFNRFRSWWLVLGVALICAAPHISFHWRLVMDAISAIAILGAVENGFSPLGNAILSTPAARFLGKI